MHVCCKGRRYELYNGELPGKYRKTGLLDGEAITGLIPADDDSRFALNSLLVFPKPQMLEKVNGEFKKISPEKAAVWTKEKSDLNYNKGSKNLSTILAVVFVMAFASGNSVEALLMETDRLDLFLMACPIFS